MLAARQGEQCLLPAKAIRTIVALWGAIGEICDVFFCAAPQKALSQVKPGPPDALQSDFASASIGG
jgi:hypothetical protein